MSDRWLFVLTFVSALSCGLVSSVFFAFRGGIIDLGAPRRPCSLTQPD